MKQNTVNRTNMKALSQIPLAIIGVILSTLSAHAQSPPTPPTPVEGRQHQITLGLTISSQGASTTATGTHRGTTTTTVAVPISTKRFSNRELLNLLVSKNVITSITGWSVSYFTDLSGNNVGAYIVKTGATPISIDAYLNISKTTGALQGTSTATATVGTTTTTTVTGSNLSLVPLYLGANFQAQGLYSNETATSASSTTVGDFEIDNIVGSDAYNPTTGAPVAFVPATNSIIEGWIYGSEGRKANLP